MASYKLGATHGPIPFTLTVEDIKDANGNPVERSEVVASAAALGEATVEFDDATGQGTLTPSGAVGSASVEYKVVDKDDPEDILAVKTDGFSFVADDPASVGTVNVVFEGITPEPEPVPEP